ncbi:MAG TPA: SRPBCC domain-containing protein [Pedobacter sp.]|uniref:SRPBCC family protein n=1 Tax=Pedobacter sp. TaxID=1411316 RepID=UPI002C774B4D|nr:SRPBCC domain-containing protein [Pedobacter sp.]HMI02078.1 SRPBCC domain-containing protein [Pedobacter sp.]
MKKKEFRITIDAPRERVWNVIIGEDTYPIWTAVFAEGSNVETDWKKGSRAIFGDGKGSGMVAEIAENIPYEFLSIRHLGEIINGKEDTTSDRVKEWAGSTENYTLTEKDGKTEWLTELDITEEFADYFDKTWPRSMEIVKELAEKK